MRLTPNIKTMKCPFCSAEVKEERCGDYFDSKPSRNKKEVRKFFCGYEITYAGGKERPVDGSKCPNSREEKAKAKSERKCAEEVVAFIESKIILSLDPKEDAPSGEFLRQLVKGVKEASRRYEWLEINPPADQD